ncbi:hypothetical protein MMC28_005798 [Mycoblastus sanguinarius]|nr:hypothetical protein [Mycoblastus sanguinarius]
MEARLLQMQKFKSDKHWHIAPGSGEGIPLSQYPLPDKDDFFVLGPTRAAFLQTLLGRGGLWEGWELHAAFKVKKLENMKISNVTLTREKPLACNGSGGEVSGRMEFLADLTW